MPSKKQPNPAAAKATAPAQATDNAPIDTAAANPPAPPPADPPPAVPPLFCCFTDLGDVRRLPEAPTGDTLALGLVQFHAGTIEQFADEGGRTMRIVNAGGALHKYPVPEVPAETTETTEEGA